MQIKNASVRPRMHPLPPSRETGERPLSKAELTRGDTELFFRFQTWLCI